MKFTIGNIIVIIVLLVFSGCYRFQGVTIDNTMNTYEVYNFETQAPNAPPTLALSTREAIREWVRRQSKLIIKEVDPDVEFQGKIRSFRVSSVAPQPGELSAFNRLEITFEVEYINNVEGKEEEGFKKNYTLFSDFPSTSNLLDVQDGLIETILNELKERVFNDAFTNW